MNKNTWIAIAALGLVAAAPSAAHAHGQYLQAVSDFVDGQYGGTACALPGMTCGLCHQPLVGDPLLDITVDNTGIETTVRSRSFYEGLTGPGGWAHSMHMAGDMTHINMNRMMLVDMVLPGHLDHDGDGDGLSDLEELSRGHNPLVAYDEGNPTLTQLCDGADPWPDMGGSSGTGTATSGDSTGDESGSTGNDESADSDGGSTTSGGDTTSGMGGDETGSTGGTGGDSGAADGGDEEGGCGCHTGGSDDRLGVIGLLLMLGLGTRRRRRLVTGRRRHR